jgi:hypothetical protein
VHVGEQHQGQQHASLAAAARWRSRSVVQARSASRGGGAGTVGLIVVGADYRCSGAEDRSGRTGVRDMVVAGRRPTCGVRSREARAAENLDS